MASRSIITQIQPPPLAIVGPTGSGKSATALMVADAYGRYEVISVDSMTVYREFDIGVAKPTAAEREAVPHHLISSHSVSDEYSLFEFIEDMRRSLASVIAAGHAPIYVGGTSLYLRAAIDGVTLPPRYMGLRGYLEEVERVSGPIQLHRILQLCDPPAALLMEPTNGRRIIRALEVRLGSAGVHSVAGSDLHAFPPTETTIVGIDPGRQELFERIDRRIDEQLGRGWLDEVTELAATGVHLSRTAAQAIGYGELLGVIKGERSLDDAVSTIRQRTKRLAKRQLSWLRRDPRITWWSGSSEAFEFLVERLKVAGVNRRSP